MYCAFSALRKINLKEASSFICFALMQNNVIVFIHGFLGSSNDWIDIMKVTSGSARCISLDIPGHGGSKINYGGAQESCLSMEVVADFLHKFIGHVTPRKVTLVGYSMGARIALYMALKFVSKVNLITT